MGHAAGTGSLLLLAKDLCASPQPDGGDAPGQDMLWAEHRDRTMLAAGQGEVPISSIHAVKGLAIGKGASWENGNAKE